MLRERTQPPNEVKKKETIVEENEAVVSYLEAVTPEEKNKLFLKRWDLVVGYGW